MGASRNRLILADVSANLKLFANPPGPGKTGSEDRASWACQLVQSPHTDVIGDMDVSSCGLWLVTGGHDQSICLWHLIESGDKPPTLVPKYHVSDAHGSHISAVCFSK